jgi:hypothetical protein
MHILPFYKGQLEEAIYKLCKIANCDRAQYSIELAGESPVIEGEVRSTM